MWLPPFDAFRSKVILRGGCEGLVKAVGRVRVRDVRARDMPKGRAREGEPGPFG